ncbi:MAG: ABC transporter permease, partial [Bacteroidota bacterium]
NKTWGYSLINIMGLALGMGVCLALCQYIYFELSYDRFHSKQQNTYRVVITETNSTLQDSYPFVGYGLAEEALAEIPEIKAVVRKNRFNRGGVLTNPSVNAAFHEEGNDLLFVDPSFLDVFDFPMLRGDRALLFSDPYNIVLTKSTAQKYFGTADPIGQTLTIDGPPSPGNYVVSGIVADPPLNTHLQFHCLIPIQNYIDFGWGGAVKKNGPWLGFNDFVTYIEVAPAADPVLVQRKLNQLLLKHRAPDDDLTKRVSLQPLADIYLKSTQLSDIGYFNRTGNPQAIRFFSIIALAILLIAWTNYINLTTAKSRTRAKEIGIRKSLGALRTELLNQFLMESVVVNFIAALLALGIAFSLFPVLNYLVGKNLGINIFLNPLFWLVFVGVVLLGSLLAGFYPAFVLSRFNPISNFTVGRRSDGRKLNLRQGLITFQFVAAFLLIAATNLIYQQTSFMKGQDLGIAAEQVLILRGPQQGAGDKDILNSFSAFKNELASHHSVLATTGSFMMPGQYWTTPYQRSGRATLEAPHTRGFPVALDFPETYGLEFIAGRSFQRNMIDEATIIINEAAVEVFGFGSAENAIQQQLVMGKNQRTIVGVVKDFHWHSLVEAHTPYVIQLYDQVSHPYLSVRLNAYSASESLPHVQAIFQRNFPNTPFEFHFADDVFNRQYQADLQFGNIFLLFTLLAIFIACLGLFALVSYSAGAKKKELGVRKVFGASTANLMGNLIKEYLILLLLAVILATPILLYGGQQWLQ